MADHGEPRGLNSKEEEALQLFLEKGNSEMLRVGFPPVSTGTALRFLMARKFDAGRAMALFKRHLEIREKYNMADIQPLDEPLSKELLSEKFTFLERCKENQPAIILVNGKYYKPEKSNNGIVIQSLIFQLDEALRDTSTQRHGLILIYNMTESGRQNFNYSLSLEILNLLKDAYPARLKKIFIISAPLWFRVSFKIIATFLNEKIRERVEFVDSKDIQEHLVPECIPSELGGRWKVNHSLWMTRCIQSYREGSCAEPCLQIKQRSVKTAFATGKDVSPVIPAVQKDDVPLIPPEDKIPYRDKIPTDGLTVQQLLAHMKQHGPRGLKREFETLETFDRKCTHDVFKIPYNRGKNRYVDVICLDHSRVHIPITDEDETTNYIHANYMNGYHKENAYIAAQGPLPATFNDFWRMVLVSETAVIVMLTKEIQRGRMKCGRYWPDAGNFELYNDIEVSCVEEAEKGNDFIIRTFLLTDTKKGETRHVHQIQMMSWPDFGVPDSAEPIFQLKTMVESLQNDTKLTRAPSGCSRPPVVVHCSAGIGRTGSYCTISIGIDSLLDTGHCNVMGTVTRMRGQRAQTVQTADQYEFCYTALLEYAALHVDSIEAEEKIEILEFLNDWKKTDVPGKEMAW